MSPRPLAVVGDLYREDHVHILTHRVGFAQMTLKQGGPDGDVLQVCDENGEIVLKQPLSSCSQLARIDDSGLFLQELRAVVCFLPPSIIDIMCSFAPLQEEAQDDPISAPTVAFHLPDEDPPLRALIRGGIAWLSSRPTPTGTTVNAWRFYFQDNRPSTALFIKSLFSSIPNNEPVENGAVCDSNQSELVCARGSKLTIWDGSDDLKRAPTYALKTKDGEELQASCVVLACCGPEALPRVLLLSSHRPDTVFVFDMKQTEVVEEWKLNTTILTIARCKNTEGKLIAAGINSVFVVDTFAAENKVSWLADYSQRRELSALSGAHERILVAAESPVKLLAASNDERKLRIYNGVSRRTRGRIGLGPLSRIRALEVAENPCSHYVLVTKTHCVLLFSTVVEPWSGKSVFEGVPLKLIHGVLPCKLSVSHADCIRFNINKVSFTPAALYQCEIAASVLNECKESKEEAETGPELVIASSTGPFVVIWTVSPRIHSDLSPSYVTYSISKQSEEIAHLLWGPNKTLIAVSAVSEELFAIAEADP
jgi:hypothetical protein